MGYMCLTMRAKTGVMLTLAGLAAFFVGCREKPESKESKEEPRPKTGVVIDSIVNGIAASGDEDYIRKAAKTFEEQGDSRRAMQVYILLKEESSMIRLAMEKFPKDSDTLTAEALVEMAGLKLTPNLYNDRGNYQFGKGEFVSALYAYTRADNKKGIRKAALKVEEQGLKNDSYRLIKSAFEAYLHIGDEVAAYRLAKWQFIHDDPVRHCEMLNKLGKKPTKDLWNLSGNYIFALWKARKEKNDAQGLILLRKASAAYQNAEEKGRVKELAQLYLAELTKETTK